MFPERILSHKLFFSCSQATKETFSTARVLIGPANRAWGDVPTPSTGLCGIEGDYIHLTPDFITTTTTTQANPVLEKNIVKEFAHLKWGLFDEGVSVTDIKTPVYYSVNGASQPTRCGNQPFWGILLTQTLKSPVMIQP
ncbi:hypothetical protein EB796_014123 [Bugula neritina]|uniref:Calcium-activated chloride channel N-terminal domain-containing protein n=1 Tax=Bugula neritina TaxID=10212 RepID=A0A7J7JMK8_BUGNE|nr:hypothetical protein EB796_014123 [Bugula neritina]